MPEVKFVAPLKVPPNVAVTPNSQKRYDSGFSPSLTIDEALSYLNEECELLPRNAQITIYTNYDHLAIASARRKLLDDCSVCCEVRLDSTTAYIVSHQWGLTEQNLYAVHLTLRAIHNIARWGVSDVKTLLAAFAPNASAAEAVNYVPPNEEELVNRGQWLAILRLNEQAGLAEANEAYRFFAKKSAQSEEGLLRLNQAIAAAREYFSKRSA